MAMSETPRALRLGLLVLLVLPVVLIPTCGACCFGFVEFGSNVLESEVAMQLEADPQLVRLVGQPMDFEHQLWETIADTDVPYGWELFRVTGPRDTVILHLETQTVFGEPEHILQGYAVTSTGEEVVLDL